MADEPPPEPADTAPEVEVIEVRRRSWPVTVTKWVLGIATGLVALILLVVLGVNTGPGKRFVVDQIEQLAFENGMKISVGRIEGSLYGRMVLRNVSVHDTKGEFLFSPAIAVDWHPFAYLRNHVDVESARAERVILRRSPVFKPTPPSDAPLLPDLDIDVGRLRIDRFISEKPVTGEVRVLSIDGRAQIADGRAQVTAHAATIAGGGRVGGDRLVLRLDAVPARNRLDIDLAVDAPGDGVFAALAGLKQPASLRVAGRGDWKAWDGTLDANLAGTEFARLALSARDGSFAVKGPTRIGRLFSGVTAGLLGPVTQFNLAAVLAERRATVSGSISSDAFALNPAGVIDLAANGFDELRMSFVLLRPSAIAPNLSGSGLRGIFTLNGPFATPRVVYALNADRLVMNDMGLERLTATGEARVDADAIVVPVTARVARITGLDTVAGGTLTNVRLNGDLAIDGPRILSDNMRLASDRIDAKLVLLADTSRGLYTGAVDGRIDNYRVESVGVFDINTDIDLKTEAQGFALAGKVRARSKRIDNAGVARFLGGQATASSNVRYGSDGVVRFSGLRLEAPLLRVTDGEGSYTPDGRIVLNARGVSRQYGAVGVRLAGTIANPNATVTAARPGLGIGLANLQARIVGARGGYRFDARGDTDYGPLVADVTLGTGPGLTLQVNSANLGGIDFAGNLRQTAAGPFAGQLTANGQGLSGLVRLDGQGRYQAATVNLRATDTVLPGPAKFSVGAAIVDARIVLYDRPWIVADAQVARAHYGSFDISAARVLVDYRNGTGKAKALVEGSSGIPFRIAANADLTPRLWRVAASGRARGIDFRTDGPARIVPGRGSYELLPTKIAFGSGSARLAGRYGPGLKLQSRLDALDMSIVNAFYPGYGIGGKATGSLDFEQVSPSAFPRADARLTIDNFTRTTAASVSQPVDVNFVGKLLADGGEARAVFRERGAVIGRMIASLRPLGPGAGAWTDRLLAAPLSGGIRYNGPADTLFSIAGLRDQRLSGPIGLAADFSCRVSDPCLSGVVRANALTYENQRYGTKLTRMALTGRFTGSRIDIEQMTANAGNGRVSAKGTISLSAANGYPMDLAIRTDNARLAQSEGLTARATGDLRLTKVAGEAALLSGKLRLPETRYKIVREGAAQVPELTGVRFKPPRGYFRVTGDEPAQQGPGLFEAVRLNLELNAPERLYVSGMGLESEWRANFTIGGTNLAPTMAGQVELIRGTLGFAGRSFELTRGRVDFTGGRTIDPIVEIAATEDIEDVDVTVNVAGRAYNPQITFSSVPGLPQDEIMARVLFGSSIANLSALQAVQLATSLNSLRGGSGGLNPLGKLRSATGIDRLRILGPDDTTGRGTALAAGQYITNDIYVELITDARGFTATQLEISLTKWLSVLGQAGGSGATSFNARIKKDY